MFAAVRHVFIFAAMTDVYKCAVTCSTSTGTHVVKVGTLRRDTGQHMRRADVWMSSQEITSTDTLDMTFKPVVLRFRAEAHRQVASDATMRSCLTTPDQRT